MSAGDGADLTFYYLQDETICVALRQVAQVLIDNGFDAADLLREAENYRQDIRAAAEVSIARTPVARVADGTCRRIIPFAPYCKGIESWGFLQPVRFGRDGIFAFDEPIMQEMLDVIEEMMSSRSGFETGGHGGQVGLDCHWKLYLFNDDVPLFLRAMYNGYAAEIRPWQANATGWEGSKLGYVFRGGRLLEGNTEGRAASYVFSEGPFGAGDNEKVFEEAALARDATAGPAVSAISTAISTTIGAERTAMRTRHRSTR